jgi:hypothetical protein
MGVENLAPNRTQYRGYPTHSQPLYLLLLYHPTSKTRIENSKTEYGNLRKAVQKFGGIRLHTTAQWYIHNKFCHNRSTGPKIEMHTKTHTYTPRGRMVIISENKSRLKLLHMHRLSAPTTVKN